MCRALRLLLHGAHTKGGMMGTPSKRDSQEGLGPCLMKMEGEEPGRGPDFEQVSPRSGSWSEVAHNGGKRKGTGGGLMTVSPCFTCT